jgi:DNA-binding XRE family transcriptional regulator
MRELGVRYNQQTIEGSRSILDEEIEKEIQLTLGEEGRKAILSLNRSNLVYPGYFQQEIDSGGRKFIDYTKRVVNVNFIPINFGKIKSLEEAFAEFRRQTSLSKAKLDRLSGVSQTTIRYIENRVRDGGAYNGTTKIGKVTFNRYLALMDITSLQRTLLTTLYNGQL